MSGFAKTQHGVKRREKANDVVGTPKEVAKEHIAATKAHLDFSNKPVVWYDPFRFSRDGSYYKHFPKEHQKKWAEIIEGKDFFEYDPGPVDVICSNPPFSLVDLVLKQSVLLQPQIISYLLNFSAGTAKRMEFMNQHGYRLMQVRQYNIHKFGSAESAFWIWKRTNYARRVAPEDNIVEYNRTVWHRLSATPESATKDIRTLAQNIVEKTSAQLPPISSAQQTTVWLDPFRNKDLGDLYSKFPTKDKRYCTVDQSGKSIYDYDTEGKVDVVCGILPKDFLKQLYKNMKPSARPGEWLNAAFDRIMSLQPSVISLALVEYQLTPKRLRSLNNAGYTLAFAYLFKLKHQQGMTWNCVWVREDGLQRRKNVVEYATRSSRARVYEGYDASMLPQISKEEKKRLKNAVDAKLKVFRQTHPLAESSAFAVKAEPAKPKKVIRRRRRRDAPIVIMSSESEMEEKPTKIVPSGSDSEIEIFTKDEWAKERMRQLKREQQNLQRKLNQIRKGGAYKDPDVSGKRKPNLKKKEKPTLRF